MLKTQTINNMFQPPYKMNFIPQMIANPNQFMIKCIPQNVFFPLQDIYKGYTNSLRIKLPYTIDKTTLLNIFLFYGKIEFIDINPETNVVLIERNSNIISIKLKILSPVLIPMICSKSHSSKKNSKKNSIWDLKSKKKKYSKQK